MSHFSVLVIGPNPEKQLAPYHEFECTGDDNEFVVDVDKTAEYRAEYEKRTEKRLRAPDGTIHSFFDDFGNWDLRFSKKDPSPLFKGDNRRIKHIPEGYTEVEVPTKDTQSFAEFINDWAGLKLVLHGNKPNAEDHKYGYVLLDEKGDVIKAIDRTNPNARWDWYQLGGRYTGMLKLKTGQRPGILGEPGLMTPKAELGWVDQAFKGAIDFDGMRDAAEARGRARYKQVYIALGSNPLPISWEVTRAAHEGNIEAARAAYHDQPGLKALNSNRELGYIDDPGEEYGCTEDEYALKCRERAVSSFAVVKDGKWYERGKMGWWACVADEKDEAEWRKQTSELLNSVSDDTLISMYDCHI